MSMVVCMRKEVAEFIDDDFTAIPLPLTDFWRRCKKGPKKNQRNEVCIYIDVQCQRSSTEQQEQEPKKGSLFL